MHSAVFTTRPLRLRDCYEVLSQAKIGIFKPPRGNPKTTDAANSEASWLGLMKTSIANKQIRQPRARRRHPILGNLESCKILGFSPFKGQDRVALRNTIRPSLCKLTFVFIGLAISVLIWGTQYKVSLYLPSHSIYHQIPEAKLLSQKEQSVSAQPLLILSAKSLADLAHGQLFTLTLFASMLALPAIAGANQTEEELKRPWLVASRSSLDAFFFRPPPTFA
jgi:hypothetical protein